ncbi:uncharacterized protein PV09_07192 [Verruconis gallopava]|uniref:Protein SVP26 n=1 Tax=Verruconis gallopava TaxID=253628 RepID=A0A0D1YKS8_9PEZI|nr:uncharacterized protein PV09_07192 [Verruconis gallopava]KIW01432.1 hypothetical protein PV09_07192 [Verruconis gallopava]
MWILPLVGYIGLILGFCFLTLAIASGLYYLSELVEEHTVFAKKLLQRLIYSVIALQILLCVVDRFPFMLSMLSVGSHVVYMQNLRRFPVVKLTDPMFLLSCVLVLLNHYLWFNHFQAPPKHTSGTSYYYNDPIASSYPTFTEISSYFGLCVWLVPFSLFVALSAGENVLPSMGSEYATGEGSSFVTPGKDPAAAAKGLKGREGMAKQAVNGVREWFSEAGASLGLWKGENIRKW